jgi:hypothetical protein
LGKNPKALARLSKKNHWVRRAAEYDAFVGQRTSEAVAQGQADQARLYQKLAIKFVEELITGLEEGTICFNTQTLIENAIRFFPIFKDVANMANVAETVQGKRPEQAPNKEDVHPVVKNPELLTETQGKPDENRLESLSDQSGDDKASEGERPDASTDTPSHRKTLKRRSFRAADGVSEPQ